jgi:hypothetical protein
MARLSFPFAIQHPFIVMAGLDPAIHGVPPVLNIVI